MAVALPPPRQLPMRVYCNFHGTRVEGIIYWIDNLDGEKNVPGRHMRSCSFIRMTRVPENQQHLLNQVISGLSKSVILLTNNTRSGWDVWRCAETGMRMCEFQHSRQGRGFRQHPLATTLHRDWLASRCFDEGKRSYYNTEENLTWSAERVYEFFEQYMPVKTVLSIGTTTTTTTSPTRITTAEPAATTVAHTAAESARTRVAHTTAEPAATTVAHTTAESVRTRVAHTWVVSVVVTIAIVVVAVLWKMYV